MNIYVHIDMECIAVIDTHIQITRYRYPNGILKKALEDPHRLRPTFIISSTSSRVGGSFQGPGTVLLISLPHIR